MELSLIVFRKKRACVWLSVVDDSLLCLLCCFIVFVVVLLFVFLVVCVFSCSYCVGFVIVWYFFVLVFLFSVCCVAEYCMGERGAHSRQNQSQDLYLSNGMHKREKI